MALGGQNLKTTVFESLGFCNENLISNWFYAYVVWFCIARKCTIERCRGLLVGVALLLSDWLLTYFAFKQFCGCTLAGSPVVQWLARPLQLYFEYLFFGQLFYFYSLHFKKTRSPAYVVKVGLLFYNFCNDDKM